MQKGVVVDDDLLLALLLLLWTFVSPQHHHDEEEMDETGWLTFGVGVVMMQIIFAGLLLELLLL